MVELAGELDFSRFVAIGNSLKQETTTLSARPIEPLTPAGIHLSIVNSPLETVAMPYFAEALKDQADDLTLACNSFSQSRFFFISPSHLDAYLQLLDSIQQRRGLTILIGEPGIGRTTLLTKLISETPPRIKWVLCDPIDADFDSLLALINERLGLSAPGDTRSRRLSALQGYLNAPTVKIESLVLLIEDAQYLSETAFEEIFKLILSQQDARCTLRLILSGSPRLTQYLAQRKILRVLPADTLFLHLSPLDSAATATYIYRQLGNAGNLAPEALFPASVIARIAHYAHGLPQFINRLCERALEIARQAGQSCLTVEMVDQAVNELEIDSSPTAPSAPTGWKPPSLYFGMLVVLASLLAVLIGLPYLLARLPPIPKPGAAAAATVSVSATDQSAGQSREPPLLASTEPAAAQTTTAVPAVPPAAAQVSPIEPPAPDSAPQAPGAVATGPVDAIATVPAAELPATPVEPPASDVKPAAVPPAPASATQAPVPKPAGSRPERVSSAKSVTNRRTHSLPPAQPIVPAVQVHKIPPPHRSRANLPSTQDRPVAYWKHAARPMPRSELAAQGPTESNGWRIRK